MANSAAIRSSVEKEYIRGTLNSTFPTGGGSGTITIPYDTILEQVGTSMSLNTTTNRIVFSKAGGYVFTASVQTGNYNISTNDTVEFRAFVYTSANLSRYDIRLDHIEADGANTGASARLSGTFSVNLDAGDEIEMIYISSNTSGTLNIIGVDNGTYFTAMKAY